MKTIFFGAFLLFTQSLSSQFVSETYFFEVGVNENSAIIWNVPITIMTLEREGGGILGKGVGNGIIGREGGGIIGKGVGNGIIGREGGGILGKEGGGFV